MHFAVWPKFNPDEITATKISLGKRGRLAGQKPPALRQKQQVNPVLTRP
jgi:hypothetical protein